MGKTVRGIIQAGLQIAAVVPGPHQPFAAAAAVAFSVANATLFNKAPKPEQTETAIKTERPPRAAGYGRFKTFGAQQCYVTASSGHAVDVWAFHDGRIDAVEAYYLNDDRVTINAQGFVQKGEDGRYGDGDTIQIGANLGLPIETAHAPVIARVPQIWTAAHRGDGIVSGFMVSKPVKTQNYQSVYATGGPNATPLALVMRASCVFDWRDPSQQVGDPRTWKWSENPVLALAHYKLVREARPFERAPQDAGYWDEVAAVYAERWGRLFTPTLASWTAAANDCDAPMPLKAGGTEPRYRTCLSHKLAGDGSQHKAVVNGLLACFDGWMAPREDGALVVYSGRYYTPTVTLGTDAVVSYTVDSGVEDEDAVNEITVTYVSDQHDFNTVDTDPWTDEDDIARRGAVRSESLENQVPSHAQARRLAKRKMAQDTAHRSGTCTTNSYGAAVVGQRFIRLRLIEGEGTPFEFVAHVGTVEVTQLKRNLETGAVVFSWRAVDPSIDAWNPETEEGEPAPVGNRIAREPLEAPTIISAAAQFSAVGQNPDGEDETGETIEGGQSTGARVFIVTAGPDREDLTWYARWRVGASGPWSEDDYPDADPGPGVSLLTGFVPLASNINVQTAYQTGDGRQSPWSDGTVVDTRKA